MLAPDPQGPAHVSSRGSCEAVDLIEDALKYSLDALARRAKGQLLPYHSERLKYRMRDEDKFRARLSKNGPQAVSDFYGKA